jgi:Zn-finger nucleic acid-binding protein
MEIERRNIQDESFARGNADATQSTAKDQEIRFRCPHCQKLYCTTTDVFDGQAPAEFDCSSCDHPFILNREIDSFGLYNTAVPPKVKFDSCPKCSHLKPAEIDECPSCGIVVSRYLELQKIESPALYDLNRQWQQVVIHFDEDQYHQDFINKCHLNMALNFAFQKYAELQKTLGSDALCETYMKQIELRLEQQIKSPKVTGTGVKPIVAYKAPLSAMQLLFLGAGALGMILLIYNKYVPTFPNFNGLVLSLTVMAFGIGLFANSNSQVINQK